MLQEFHGEQPVGRRWFEDEYLDLIIWSENDGRIRAFQICYAKGSEEGALSWSETEGYAHWRVDSGDWRVPHIKPAAALEPSPYFPRATVLREFDERGEKLSQDLRQFIRDKLRGAPHAYGGRAT